MTKNNSHPKDKPAKSHHTAAKEVDKPSGPKQLPNELIDVILDICKTNTDLTSLAAVARANHQMYDLAIEKLYETITMTEWNEKAIGYGTSDQLESEVGINAVKDPTRKDAAAAFTRKIIFDCVPQSVISNSFKSVEEVVLTTRSYCMNYDNKWYQEDHHTLKQCLSALALPKGLSNPLHLTVHVSRGEDFDICELEDLFDGFPPVPIICEIMDLPPQDTDNWSDPFALAYYFGGILHVSSCSCGDCQSGETSDCRDDFAKDVAHELEGLLECDEDDVDGNGVGKPPGQIFLCNVSRLMLNPDELIAAGGEANDSARLKVFKLLDYDGAAKHWPEAKKWDHYTSMVKFVDSGFRPSEADVAANVKLRQWLASLPKSPLTDESTGESDSEWSDL